MHRRCLDLLISALLAIFCSAFNSSAHAQESFFTFKSKGSGRCLHVKGGDQPNGGEIRVFDPCQTLPEFRVERVDGILRIKLTPQNFKCLQVKQPVVVDDVPVKVTPGNCFAPVSNWFVGSPDADGLRQVILRQLPTEPPSIGMCMQENIKQGTTEVVVDFCDERSKWTLESVPPPF
jgi:hypothetical protein